MNKEFDEAFKHMDKAFKSAEKAFSKPFVEADQIPSEITPDSKTIKINFTNNRIATARKFLVCAAEMLFSGKTSLFVVKKK